MPTKLRIFLAVVLLLLMVGLVALGRLAPRHRTDPVAEAASNAPLGHEDCRQCHQDVWREWTESFHSRAWADASVQAAFRHFGFDRKCQTCHAPLPVLLTGMDAEVRLRDEDPKSGVNCLSCHGLPSGEGVAAGRAVPEAPCRPVRRPEIASGSLCGKCHESIHDDWKQSRYARNGQTCQSCHMPQSEDRQGHSHLCLGGHDPKTVRAGATMSCRQEADELIVTVTNHATGHNFPGERHHRVVFLVVTERKSTGVVTLVRKEIIKETTPFRGETSAEMIRAGQTFEARFPADDPPVVAEVELLYKHFPWVPDRQALVVRETQIELEKP